MPRRSVCLSLALFACAPKPPADTGDASTTSTASTDGATSTWGAPTTSSSTDAASTTALTTDDAPSTTELPPESSTGAPENLPIQILVVEARPSEVSGVDGLERWESDPFAECPGQGPCGGVPTLGKKTKWFVDGEFTDPSAIHIGSRVAILLPFDHPDCALACGFHWSSATDEVEGGGGGGTLPADLPCRTAAQGVWLAIDFGLIVRGGPHQAALRLEDRCGSSTEAWSATFEPK